MTAGTTMFEPPPVPGAGAIPGGTTVATTTGAQLSAIRAALGRLRTGGTPVRWAAMGDSVTEQWNATTLARVYHSVCRNALMAECGLAAHTAEPLGFRRPGLASDGWTQANIVADNATGWGLYAGRLTAGLASTLTGTMDRGIFFFQRVNASQGTIRCTVDGGASLGGDQALNGTTDPWGLAIPAFAARTSFTRDTGAMAQAAHTLSFLETLGVNNAHITGAYAGTDADWSAGISVLNGGHFGFSTTQFAGTAAAPNPDIYGLPVLAGAQLVTINLMTNEISLAPGVLQSNLVQILTILFAGYDAAVIPRPSVILMIPWATAAYQAAPARYSQARQEVYAAAAVMGAAVFDYGALTGPPAAGNPLGWSGDQIHPSDAGHDFIGRQLARFILSAV